jgi:phage portal protein BeeE
LNPVKFFANLFKGKDATSDRDNGDLFGWSPLNRYSTYRHYKDNQYENAYPSISRIANEFLSIAPYAVDGQAKRITEANAVDKLYHPNQDMSSDDFREAVAIMMLVHPQVHILVWHWEGEGEGDKAIPGWSDEYDESDIAGYTFLEGVIPTKVSGETRFYINGYTFTDKEVITLKGINPYDLDRGWSPAQAARRWSKLDDYIADYQTGFFENGAVPAGEFVITARTKTEFDDMVNEMQERHRGAGKNNNVTYTHRPIDPSTNKPLNAQIEWTPFNQANKDLDLEAIFTQVNKKLDSTYGVPASVRGDSTDTKYSNIEADQYIFIRYVVKPFTRKIWSRFTHELNRITGGMGYAISFRLDIPDIADQKLVVSKTRQVDAQTIREMVAAGYTLASIVDAFDFPVAYKKLSEKATTTVDETTDNPDIDNRDEVEDSPNPDIINDPLARDNSLTGKSKKAEGDKACECCKGYGEHTTGYECYGCDATGLKSEFTGSIPCGGREDSSELWVDSDGQYRHMEEKKSIAPTEEAKVTNPKDGHHNHDHSKQMTYEQRQGYEAEYAVVTHEAMSKQINRAIAEVTKSKAKALASKEVGDPTEDETEDFRDALLAVAIGIMLTQGQLEYATGARLLADNRLPTNALTNYALSNAVRDRYRSYLLDVANSYGSDTATSIRSVLDRGAAEGWTRAQLTGELRNLLDVEKWRIDRLAVTETNRSQGLASVDAMEQIQAETGYKIRKVWNTSGANPCEFCLALDGKTVGVEDAFIPLGGTVEGVDGGTLVNNFTEVESANAHPNCHCYVSYEIVPS